MSSRVRIFDSALADLAGEVAVDAVDEALDEGVDMAQRLVPIDTGELHDGIRVVEPATRTPDGAVGYYGVTDVDHALPVELGTINAPAQPYLRPSIDGIGRRS